ncbi:molybdenum cofactor biosynthesis protein MoaD [Butyricicoccus sp. AM18-35]|nr:molybdenum cofactor biosynthesis protein MoaD [Butyricicoccus sp. AM18-35]RHQ65943.1 molybdenum cofactor biosynthesis protein MoaD [Butyricicoccus sp. AF24-19AC]RHR83922.1 molybdenum cofactor biosynthesis protein MoaD [Butyricicoccus sp. AF15-40]RHV73085.1 molybdenum cofactor biosynthesis protein MoaD [Butyricicoccus sp. OF13-6]RHV79625.1 molybdenum cofactor biosynthesis protein MoaD [Butyricicoccus sp. OF10-2]
MVYCTGYHPHTGRGRGCSSMEILSSFVISVVAGVIANYICKWLDGDK